MNFLNQEIEGEVFTGENLAGASFKGARLIDCEFKSCDLSNAVLLGASREKLKIALDLRLNRID